MEQRDNRFYRQKSYDCEQCRDSGTVARSSITGMYKFAGPVPEDARRVYEDFCDDCAEGQKMRRETRF
jgi:hypothetical protein